MIADKLRFKLLPAVALSLAMLADVASAAAMRFLPSVPFSLGGGTNVTAYGGVFSTFDQDVICDGVKCGSIKFDYETWTGKTAGGTDTGGAALSGGFYASADAHIKVARNRRLSWVQTVIATVSGANDWGIVIGEVEFPDASRTSPEYPFQTAAQTPPNAPGAPYLGFQDFPNRFFTSDQRWLAELALVCIDDTLDANGFNQVYVIDSFLWGFGVDSQKKEITANAPHAWGAPTASFLSTLNGYYDGSPPIPPTSGGTSSKYHFQAGCDDCFIIPEPLMLPLVVTLLLLLMWSRVRRRNQIALRDRGMSKG